MDTTQITILVISIIVGSIFLVALGVIFYIFVISKSKIRKQIKELQRRYSYLNALLIGQDSQYIHRLEIISHTNLLYAQKHEAFSHRFKDLYENDDKYVSSYLKQLNLLLSNNQYRGIKSVIMEARKTLVTYEERATALDKDLYSLIKLEEEARQAILRYKEDYRHIKQIYYDNSTTTDLISNSINKIFIRLDSLFSEYDTNIDSASYDEAKVLIPEIGNILSAVNHVLTVMPDLCALVDDIIPHKIEEVKSHYEDASNKNIPLYHLAFNKTVEDWFESLKGLKNKLLTLHTNSVKAEAEVIEQEIAQMNEKIDKELADKNEFDNNVNGVYADSVELEKKFMKISSILPEITKVYVISEERKLKIESLRGAINRLSSSRNTLDAYIHSNVEQPYSIIMERLKKLTEDYEEAKNDVDEFKTFLDSLKNYAEEAYNLVFVYFYHTKQIESLIRNLSLKVLSDKYSDDINTCYSQLNDIYLTLKVKPIDITALNAKVEQLKSFSSTLFAEVEENCRNARLAESALVYANRDRQQQDVNAQLNELEQAFLAGEYKKVAVNANDLYHKSHAESK